MCELFFEEVNAATKVSSGMREILAVLLMMLIANSNKRVKRLFMTAPL